ncbi:hypothetical protein COV61_02270 [Candidatus Micrarchaeota archaeon CG11_big_fil_rev_8_21_14_0_20_47_5]|nr:MAG: hypothetical protein AUJ17_04160 [Candidatus Micrarchaeota archaeon CG1_02_47_40]PIN83733.1 MAG: hypothetical protein COV61_02270 [Candidatus Micrarchaeota archaeon CG11_big_fil_rev_8_21_14_0_20_47_5]QBM01431.1 hypothetical protein [uncultured archaeon]
MGVKAQSARKGVWFTDALGKVRRGENLLVEEMPEKRLLKGAFGETLEEKYPYYEKDGQRRIADKGFANLTDGNRIELRLRDYLICSLEKLAEGNEAFLKDIAVYSLIGALTDVNFTVRNIAATELGELKDGRAVVPLKEALKDGEFFVRVSAAESLAKIGDADAAGAVAYAVQREYDAIPYGRGMLFVAEKLQAALAELEAKNDISRHVLC